MGGGLAGDTWMARGQQRRGSGGLGRGSGGATEAWECVEENREEVRCRPVGARLQ
jgi:hypothetical protein